MKQEPDRLKVANSLNGQALKQVTTIADCRAVHVAKKLYFIVNRSAIRQKKKGITMDYKSEIIRMITEIDDNDMLMRVYFFIRYKYRRLKGWVDRG